MSEKSKQIVYMVCVAVLACTLTLAVLNEW